MAKPELGTKRIDPETGRKFYDLNKDPIVSPYTGKSYPLSFFEVVSAKAASRARVEEVEVETVEVDETPNTVSLAEVEDDEEGPVKDDIADIDESDDEAPDTSDDTFLEPEDEDEDDMSDIIGGRDEDEEV